MKHTDAEKERCCQDHRAIVGYEADLWRMADALRGSMDAADYEHVVHDLISSSTFLMPSRSGMQSLRPSAPREQLPRTPMSTVASTSSRFRRRTDGDACMM